MLCDGEYLPLLPYARRFLLRSSVTEPNRDRLSITSHRPMLLVSAVVPDLTGVAGLTEGAGLAGFAAPHSLHLPFT